MADLALFCLFCLLRGGWVASIICPNPRNNQHHELPDLIGYGQSSGQFDELGRLRPCTDLDVIDALVNEAGEPVDIVAHSYGAATCLEYAALNPDKVGRLLLFEPVSFHYLQNAGYEMEFGEVLNVAGNIADAHATGNDKLAARHYMSFWLGRARWLLAPRAFKQRVIDTMDKVVHEFSMIPQLSPQAARLGPIAERLTLVTGGRSRRPALATSAFLAQALPGSALASIRRAGHMMPFTHPEPVLDLVAQAMA